MLFRIVLGFYLLVHFFQLIPFAEELFGKDMPYDPTLSPIYGIFPNILNYNISATGFVVFLTMVSLIMMFGIIPRRCAFVLWYGWAALFNRNVLIANPGIPYVGWILLAIALVDRKKIDSDKFIDNLLYQDTLPRRLLWAGWFLMAAGYTASGLHKLVVSPSWKDGTALQYVLESPLAHDNFLRDLLLQYPSFLKWNTWFSLFLEISCLPLGVFYYTRLPYWIIYFCFHVGILMLINFADLTIGVLMIHFFVFEDRWMLYITKKVNMIMNNDSTKKLV